MIDVDNDGREVVYLLPAQITQLDCFAERHGGNWRDSFRAVPVNIRYANPKDSVNRLETSNRIKDFIFSR